MDVLYVTLNDWSNTGYRFCKCLRSLGLDVVGLKGNDHSMRYPEQMETSEKISKAKVVDNYPVIVSARDMRGMAEKAHVIHFSSSTFVDVGVDLRDKFVVVNHGGRVYRKHPDASNEVFNHFADKTLIQCPDLLGKGAVSEELVYYPVDTDYIQPCYCQKSDKIRIGHFPSSTEAKGTGTILGAIATIGADPKYKDRFEYIGWTDTRKRGSFVPWEEQLRLYKECDILIETINPTLNGTHFGAWGNTAIEAAASGCVVITNDLYQDVYQEEYGDVCALNIANDGEQLLSQLKRLVAMEPDELLEAKKDTRCWVKDLHGMEATAHRLKNKIYDNFFSWN